MNVRVNVDQIRRKAQAAATERFSAIMNKLAGGLRCEEHPESRARAVMTGDMSGRIVADRCCDAFRQKAETTLQEARAESQRRVPGVRGDG